MMKRVVDNVTKWLKTLSFKTGAILAGICVACYVISFAQMALPISVAAKGVLWFVFFGLAKTFQYSAILILGKVGVQRLRRMFTDRRNRDVETD